MSAPEDAVPTQRSREKDIESATHNGVIVTRPEAHALLSEIAALACQTKQGHLVIGRQRYNALVAAGKILFAEMLEACGEASRKLEALRPGSRRVVMGDFVRGAHYYDYDAHLPIHRTEHGELAIIIVKADILEVVESAPRVWS